MPQALRRELPGSISGQSERFGNRRPKERISERVEHQRKRAFRHMMILVPDGQLRDEVADRIEDGVQGIPISREDHPGSQGAGSFTAERVEALVDDDARVRFTRPGTLDRFPDARSDGVRDGLRQLALQPGR